MAGEMHPRGRDAAGRFVSGCAPGPGRPKGSTGKKSTVTNDELHAMASITGAELWLLASALVDRDKWIERIRESFPRHVVARIDALVEVSERAHGILMGRLDDEQQVRVVGLPAAADRDCADGG